MQLNAIKVFFKHNNQRHRKPSEVKGEKFQLKKKQI